jgi:hypothetical protein
MCHCMRINYCINRIADPKKIKSRFFFYQGLRYFINFIERRELQELFR